LDILAVKSEFEKDSEHVMTMLCKKFFPGQILVKDHEEL
jgi:hypothetical protein